MFPHPDAWNYPPVAASPQVVPRDDRAWPRGAVPISVVVALACLATGVALATAAAGDGTTVMVWLIAGFVVAFAFAVVSFAVGFRRWLRGHPFSGRLQLLQFVVVTVCLVATYGFNGLVGGAMLAGLFGGMMLTNAWAIRRARANRERVDAAEAAMRQESEAQRHHAADPSGDQRAAGTRDAPVGQALRNALESERRGLLAWVVATAVATAVCLVVDAPGVATFMIVFVGGALSAWALRRLWGVWLGLRDFQKAETPPRRAFVVLLHDPTPQTMRPLLGVWSEPPVVRGGRVPTPERVYRCDDELDALECYQGSVIVHEAWVDSGPRATSKPRWVAADAGIVLPHRRPVFGRWYMGSLIRGERPEPPKPLTLRAPHPDSERFVELGAHHGSFLAALGGRLAGLGALGLVSYWLT